MSVGLFIDGAYLLKIWQSLGRNDRFDYIRLRAELENRFWDQGETIDEAYYFNADPDPPRAEQNSFHRWIQMNPPAGPGFRVKLYWLQTKELFWPRSMGGQRVIHPTTHEPYVQTLQKAVDVGLVFHLLRSYNLRNWTKLILIAGDGDFYEPIQHLVENGNVHLITVGTEATINHRTSSLARQHFAIDQNADLIARQQTGLAAAEELN
jgi:uncharacterized LabA/DUF88 family protein